MFRPYILVSLRELQMWTMCTALIATCVYATAVNNNVKLHNARTNAVCSFSLVLTNEK